MSRQPAFGTDSRERLQLAQRQIEAMDAELRNLEAEFARVQEERNRYRRLLSRIADSNGHWGWEAFNALHPERAPPDQSQ